MAKTILIADDSESIRVVVGLALREAGFTVIAAKDGQEALDLLKQNEQVSLIISDLNMPMLDGILFLKEVRKLPTFKFLPFLILTTESQESKKIEAKNSGATGWIIKPFVKEKLITVVNKVIR